MIDEPLDVDQVELEQLGTELSHAREYRVSRRYEGFVEELHRPQVRLRRDQVTNGWGVPRAVKRTIQAKYAGAHG